MKKEKILVVEDERIIAIDLQRRLERFGYQVLDIVSTGEKALETAPLLNPDIILMDIMLSGNIDGIEAAKTIREKHSIPVIFLTAYSDERTIERAKVAEPFGYILKPFKDKELYTAIDIALYKNMIDGQLKRQERWLSAILNSIEDGIIATNTENKVSFMNPVAEKLLGLSEMAASGKDLKEVVTILKGEAPPQNPIQFPSPREADEKSYPFSFKNTLLTNKKGETINVDGSIAAIKDRNEQMDGLVLAVRDTTAMKRLSETIDYQASHDSLTGVTNRERFSTEIKSLIKQSEEDHSSHSLIYLDIDRFKIVNDTCGHAAGDQMLIQTTAVLESVTRRRAVIGRLGGDQFGVLLENITPQDAMNMAQNILDQLSQSKLIWNQDIFSINASIGVVLINSTSRSIYDVLAEADDACYVAKDEGGNRVKFYDTDSDLFRHRRGQMEWVSKLTRALEEDRFVLYFQEIAPITRKTRGKKKGEVLIRMLDENNQIISPIDFIPAAERYNYMPAVDRWVISHAMSLYKENYRRKPDSNCVLSINLSAQSLAEETLLDFILTELQKHDLKPGAFCFEITETATITNMTTASNFIHELKRMGFSFALDDFGSGFSSFNYLRNMPVDYLKIDGTFVKNMHEDSVNSSMVEAINTMGHLIGIETIAEFVGNSQVLSQLQKLGVDYAQGYEINKPFPLDSEEFHKFFGS